MPARTTSSAKAPAAKRPRRTKAAAPAAAGAGADGAVAAPKGTGPEGGEPMKPATVVRQYLRHLDERASRPRRRSVASLERRLAVVEAELRSASVLVRLHLLQQRLDLIAELAGAEAQEVTSVLEERFVAHALAYSAQRKISWEAWRQMGVEAAVLRRAGLSRANAHLVV